MASLTVYNRSGESVGTYDVDPTEFADHLSRQLLHDALVMYRANLRQGSARSKTRAEVSGTTRKLYRQKGTGNARAGSRRSGIRRGGGHIHAKRQRSWHYRLPRKALQAATRMALAARLRDDEITMIDDLAFEEPRTREMASVLKALGLANTRLMVATASYDANLYKSARNIRGVSVSPAAELNAHSIMTPKRLLMTTAALDAIRQRLKSKQP